MKTYSDALHYLFCRNLNAKAEYKLERCLKLYKALGNPQQQYPSVHIAGTNGKGSVAFKIAKAFEMAGYRAGLYTSPHISSYRERIQINSCLIAEEDLAELIDEIHSAAQKLHQEFSFFEITTAAAFLYFAHRKVDIAIIETGMGGRLDATNALTPLLSIITSISFDHMQILGDSLQKIAHEKAGILHPGTTGIVGPSVPLSALSNHAPLIQSEDPSPNSIAREALKFLSRYFSEIKKTASDALILDPPCRFETVYTDSGAVILDIAHNPAGIQNLFARMNQKFPERQFNAVMALSKTKDLDSCLQQIPLSCPLIMTQSANDRCFPAETLYRRAVEFGFSSVGFNSKPCEAIRSALGKLTLVFGSFFIMSEIRKALGIKEICDPIDMNEHLNQTPDKG